MKIYIPCIASFQEIIYSFELKLLKLLLKVRMQLRSSIHINNMLADFIAGSAWCSINERAVF